MSPPRYPSIQRAGAVLTLGLAAWTAGVSAVAPRDVQTARVEPATVADEAAIAEFMKRVEAYVALHRQFESTLPKAPEDATPQQIDQAQRALLAALQAARAEARQGDLFTPAMTALVKRLMVEMFTGPGGQRLRASMMDENVKELPLKVNQRFPDEIPLATMPPRLLKVLPELPEQMEFRFVASQFVLLDTHAHLVVDFIPAALPGR
jgi:hypothetical protein